MKKLSKKQEFIVALIEERGLAGTREILKSISETFEPISRQTLIRILNKLVEEKWLIREGKGRGVIYRTLLATPLLSYIDSEKYFKKDADERLIAYERFNFQVFRDLHHLFAASELVKLESISKAYRKNVHSLSPNLIKKEWERLTIELSWKSSKIEGNTYTLIDTELLLKEHEEAKGHSHEEAQMILNHKAAFDFILRSKTSFKTLSIRKIEELHSLLINKMGVPKGIRTRTVGITGTRYRPLDNAFQIREALEDTVKQIKKSKNTYEKALLALLMVSYIQPFEDGNKRTARMLANAILIANDTCPLSYRSVSEVDYKKATILFYEQNNVSFFKELFMEQFEFAANNYFLSENPLVDN